MTQPTDPAKLKAQTTYNAAADHFDAAPLAFWAYFGRRTIDQLQLRPGAQVLDVACGSGASAIPAAIAVGKEGKVTAVDLAGNLLQLGREKAKDAGLSNINFEQADMTATNYADESFDAVVCVFGIFFVPDMEILLKELWRLVKPGGQLAITTWGPRIFAPAYDHWWNAVKEVRPDLYAGFNPWDRITEPASLKALLHQAGISPVRVTTENALQPLRTVEDWWTIVLGSGLRWTTEAMGSEPAARVKQKNLEALREAQVQAVETNVLYAIATK